MDFRTHFCSISSAVPASAAARVGEVTCYHSPLCHHLQEGEAVASRPDEVEDVSGDLVMDLTDGAASSDEEAPEVAEAKTNPTEIGTVPAEAKTEPKKRGRPVGPANKERRRKKTRMTKIKDKAAPKRPLTSFLLYGEETRAALQEELGTRDPAVVMKELAARYKRLPREKVEELQRLSAENQAKYKKVRRLV